MWQQAQKFLQPAGTFLGSAGRTLAEPFQTLGKGAGSALGIELNKAATREANRKLQQQAALLMARQKKATPQAQAQYNLILKDLERQAGQNQARQRAIVAQAPKPEDVAMATAGAGATVAGIASGLGAGGLLPLAKLAGVSGALGGLIGAGGAALQGKKTSEIIKQAALTGGEMTGRAPAIKGVVGLTDPLFAGALQKASLPAQKVLSQIGLSNISQPLVRRGLPALLNVAQGIPVDLALNRKPLTPESVITDITTGALFGPGQFSKVPLFSDQASPEISTPALPTLPIQGIIKQKTPLLGEVKPKYKIPGEQEAIDMLKRGESPEKIFRAINQGAIQAASQRMRGLGLLADLDAATKHNDIEEITNIGNKILSEPPGSPYYQYQQSVADVMKRVIKPEALLGGQKAIPTPPQGTTRIIKQKTPVEEGISSLFDQYARERKQIAEPIIEAGQKVFRAIDSVDTRQNLGTGRYFSETPEGASRYGKDIQGFILDPKAKMLNLSNPSDLNQFTENAMITNRNLVNSLLEKGKENEAMGQAMRNYAKQLGYDGIIGDKSFGSVVFNDSLLKQVSNVPTGVIDEAYKNTIKNGGVTINLQGGQPARGFAYSPYKNVETVINEAEMTPQHIDNFVLKNYDLLSKPGNHIGIWKDEGKYYLDVSQVGEPTAQTLQAAQDAQQLGAFDLEKFEDIPLGKIENGVYNKLYEAASHPYLLRGQIPGANITGGEAGTPEIPRGRGEIPPGQTGATAGIVPQEKPLFAGLGTEDQPVRFLKQEPEKPSIIDNGKIKYLDPKLYSSSSDFIHDVQKLNPLEMNKDYMKNSADQIDEAFKVWGKRPIGEQITRSIPVDKIDLVEHPLGYEMTSPKKINEPIEVLFRNGRYKLVDGRHRLAQAKFNKEKYIIAKVYDETPLSHIAQQPSNVIPGVEQPVRFLKGQEGLTDAQKSARKFEKKLVAKLAEGTINKNSGFITSDGHVLSLPLRSDFNLPTTHVDALESVGYKLPYGEIGTVRQFLEDSGSIRFQDGNFDILSKPTTKQMQVLENFSPDRPIYFDLWKDGENLATNIHQPVSKTKLIKFINDAYPAGKELFQEPAKEVIPGVEQPVRFLKQEPEDQEGISLFGKTLEEPQKPLTGVELGKQRQFLETVQESGKTTKQMKKLAGGMVQEYEPVTNKEALDYADKTITANIDDAKKQVLNTKVPPSAEKSAIAIRLIQTFDKQGNLEEAEKVLNSYDNQLRESGRFIQAASLWNKLSPETTVRLAEKTAKKHGVTLSEQVKKIIRVLAGEIFKMPESTPEKAVVPEAIPGVEQPVRFLTGEGEPGKAAEQAIKLKKAPEKISEKDVMTLKLLEYIADKIPLSKGELFDAYRYQNMLSNPRTHERNVYYNLFQTLITRPVDLAMESQYDLFRHPFNRAARDVSLSDVPSYYKNVFTSTNLAYNAGIQAFKQEGASEKILETSRGTSALEALRQQNRPAILSVAPRLMEASDKFFSTLIASGEKARLLKNGITDEEASQQARDLAEEYLVRKPLERNAKDTSQPLFVRALDSLGQIALAGRKLPVIGTPYRWFVPFVTTPINVAKQNVQHSPLGFLGGEFSDKQAAQAIGGSLAVAAGAMFALNDKTTWATPTDPTAKTLFYDAQKKPYSILIGDKWIPLSYFGPYSLSLAFPAAVKHYYEEDRKALTDTALNKIGRITMDMSRFLTSQTPVSGVSGFFRMLEGDEDVNPANLLGFTGGQVIPAQGLVRYINTWLDPVFRKSKTLAEAVKKDIPGLSQQLEPYTTTYGEPSKRLKANYFLPYDIGQETEQSSLFSGQLKQRQEQLQQNAVLSELEQETEKQLGQRSPKAISTQIWNELQQAKNKEEKQAIVKRYAGQGVVTPEVENNLEDLATEKVYAMTGAEKALKNASITTRATFILREMKKMNREQKQAYVKRLTAIKIITPRVEEELNRLLTENQPLFK